MYHLIWQILGAHKVLGTTRFIRDFGKGGAARLSRKWRHCDTPENPEGGRWRRWGHWRRWGAVAPMAAAVGALWLPYGALWCQWPQINYFTPTTSLG